MQSLIECLIEKFGPPLAEGLYGGPTGLDWSQVGERFSADKQLYPGRDGVLEVLKVVLGEELWPIFWWVGMKPGYVDYHQRFTNASLKYRGWRVDGTEATGPDCSEDVIRHRAYNQPMIRRLIRALTGYQNQKETKGWLIGGGELWIGERTIKMDSVWVLYYGREE